MKCPKPLLDYLRAKADAIMASRPPDEVLHAPPEYKTVYLNRWFAVPRGRWHGNIYIHQFMQSDDDRALHDHPWHNASILLRGRYLEHRVEGPILREEGFCYARRATQMHRVQLTDYEAPCITMFITGPKVRDWGFLCPQGWRHWREFCSAEDPGKVGRGYD